MSKNLAVKTFQNGTPLSNATEVSPGTWSTATASNKYWANVNNDSNNTAIYGLLYNQFAVTGSTIGGAANNNLCPSGFHVPTSAEFSTLNTFLGAATAGTQMKSTTLWASGGNGTNSSGFNGLPSGYRFIDGSWGDLGNGGYFWTTNPETSWLLLSLTNTFNQYIDSSRLGFTVRCLKN